MYIDHTLLWFFVIWHHKYVKDYFTGNVVIMAVVTP